ncbi:hypothetical protein [Eubacterium sp. 1001713B170207_170306_E7]|uniref:hypothetical protein n=1 Tax=Eubacterium sp. 1001713B170207_170306_E7 TaxID=2787097 RepID=UPI001898FC6A|nr:hypothetical protein [Eubacterium sp. 1001713B170207_170306_E7]
MTRHTIAGEFDKIKNKLHRKDKGARPKKMDVEDVISEEIDLNSEAAVNISEHNSREHANHPSIDDMTR